jgi:exopolysaccharide biosynthesis protein
MLLKGGRRVITSGSLADEQFWPTPPGNTDVSDIGLVPTDYPDDVDQTRAGRMGIGVDAENHVIAVAVPGTERGAHRRGADNAGATLVELADLLAEAGAVDAINLDGGGSTQLFYMGGLATVPGNRYGMPGVHFERMVPSVGVLY